MSIAQEIRFPEFVSDYDYTRNKYGIKFSLFHAFKDFHVVIFERIKLYVTPSILNTKYFYDYSSA